MERDIIAFIQTFLEGPNTSKFPLANFIHQFYSGEDRTAFEELFVRLINQLAQINPTPRNSGLIQFAQKLIAENFKIFDDSDYLNYWNDRYDENPYMQVDPTFDQPVTFIGEDNTITPPRRSGRTRREEGSYLPPRIEGVLSPFNQHQYRKDVQTQSTLYFMGRNLSSPFKRFKLYVEEKITNAPLMSLYLEDNFHEMLAPSHILWIEPDHLHQPILDFFEEDDLLRYSRFLKNTCIRNAKLPSIISPIITLFQKYHPEQHEIIDDELYKLEGEVRSKKPHNQLDLNLIKLLRHCIENLPVNPSLTPILEHELKDTYINGIFNIVFSKKGCYKHRSPETNLYERELQESSEKKPDSVVSDIHLQEFTHSKLITEIKNEQYDINDVSVILDRYRLALFGKYCLDEGTQMVVLVQGIGTKLRFYTMSLMEEAFYVVNHICSLTLPLSISQLENFVLNIKELYIIRDIIELSSVPRDVNITWHRTTLASPTFHSILKMSATNIPAKKLSRNTPDDMDYTP